MNLVCTQCYRYYRNIFFYSIDLVPEVPAQLTSSAHTFSWFQSSRCFQGTSEVSKFICHFILRMCTFDEPFSVQTPALLMSRERERNNMIKITIISSKVELLIIMEMKMNKSIYLSPLG